MGNCKTDWSKPYRKQLDEISQRYSYFQERNEKLSDYVEYCELTYEEVFDKYIDAWDTARKEIVTGLGNEEAEFAEKVVGWIEDSKSTSDSFLWDYLLDAALWMSLSSIRYTIINHVALKLTARLSEYLDKSVDKNRYSVVGYSLGTSVCHDVLAALADGSWTDDKGHVMSGFTGDKMRFSSIHAVSNVSKLLQSKRFPAEQSRVRPGPVGDVQSICRKYFNYGHVLDPISRVMPLNLSCPSSMLDNLNGLKHILDWNVHALDHYLEHPDVHVRMIRSFAGYRTISDEELLSAKAAIDKKNLLTAAEQLVLNDRLTSIAEGMGASPDIIDVMRTVRLFYNFLKGENIVLKNL